MNVRFAQKTCLMSKQVHGQMLHATASDPVPHALPDGNAYAHTNNNLADQQQMPLPTVADNHGAHQACHGGSNAMDNVHDNVMRQ